MTKEQEGRKGKSNIPKKREKSAGTSAEVQRESDKDSKGENPGTR